MLLRRPFSIFSPLTGHFHDISFSLRFLSIFSARCHFTLSIATFSRFIADIDIAFLLSISHFFRFSLISSQIFQPFLSLSGFDDIFASICFAGCRYDRPLSFEAMIFTYEFSFLSFR